MEHGIQVEVVTHGLLANTEANSKCRMRKAGILENLGVNVLTVRATDTLFKSRKNGAGDGNLLVTVTGGGAAGWWEDTVNTDTIGAGEDWNLTIVNGTGTSSGIYAQITVEFTSTNGDGLCFSRGGTGGSGLSVSDAGSINVVIAGKHNNATETTVQTSARAAFVCSELTTLITANDVGSASSCRLRVGAANVNLVATITASTPGVYSDSSHTDTLATTSLINTNITVPSVSGSHAVVTRNVILYTHLETGTQVNQTYTHIYKIVGRIPQTYTHKYKIVGHVPVLLKLINIILSN